METNNPKSPSVSKRLSLPRIPSLPNLSLTGLKDRLSPRNKKKRYNILMKCTLNPLPNDKILDMSKLKTFADNNLNVNQKSKFALGREENVGNGENAGYQHFLLFPQCFQKAFSLGSLKVGIAW